jgi:hypothetical protein
MMSDLLMKKAIQPLLTLIIRNLGESVRKMCNAARQVCIFLPLLGTTIRHSSCGAIFVNALI